MSILIIICLAFIQNVAFSMVSRSRNRDHMTYHATCSVFSNAVFFLTFHQLMIADFDIWLIIPYVIGTVSGSIFGAKASMKIEKIIGAVT